MTDPPQLDVRTQFGAGEALVALAGELDLHTVPKAEQAVRAARVQAASLLVDLRELTFLDSSAVHFCAELDKAASRDSNGPVRFLVGARARRVFDIVGMTDKLKLVEDPDELKSSPGD